MAQNTWDRRSFLRHTALLVLIITPALIGRCKAQQQSGETATILIIALGGGAGTIFLCFVVFFAIVWYLNRQHKNNLRASIPHPRTRTLSSFPHSQASDQHSLQYQQQNNVSLPSRAIYSASLSASDASINERAPEEYEPLSLLEATLHQGEAPPAYQEALKMKTVCVIDLPQQITSV